MPCHHHATSGGFSSILRYHICVGGVCIPLAGLVPFLIALLHAAGYLQRLRAEWFTLDYWKCKLGLCVEDRECGGARGAGGRVAGAREQRGSGDREGREGTGGRGEVDAGAGCGGGSAAASAAAARFDLTDVPVPFGVRSSSHEHAPEGFVCEGGVCRPADPAVEGEAEEETEGETAQGEKKDR